MQTDQKTIGCVFNIAASCVVPEKLVYRVKVKSLQSIIDVFDRGVSLILDGNDVDRETLHNAVLHAGHFRTCSSLGLFRLGCSPSGRLTVDAQGAVVAEVAKQRRDELAGCASVRAEELNHHGLLVAHD